MKHTIGLTEALCGFHFCIKHLDGRDIVFKTTPGDVIEPGAVRGIPGEGMPRYRNPQDKGNFYVRFEVEFPPKMFANEKNLQVRGRIGSKGVNEPVVSADPFVLPSFFPFPHR
jgi:DnaJ homolog subfamily A member 2